MSLFNGFFDNFINGVTNPKGNLGDYQHAARLYVDNNMRLAPKLKYLYHVVFNINPQIQTMLQVQNAFDRSEINILVKSVDLPGFNMKTETLNQYNRKKIVQTGVEYSPINLEFHDDNAGITSFLWESYFRYYYTDSNYTSQGYNGTPGQSSPAYSKTGTLNTMYAGAERQTYKYGLDRGGKPQNFFTSIQVFQLHPQNVKPTFTSFTLVNPVIDKFQHDKLNQESSEFSVNSMTISYEAVFYNRGNITPGINPTSFATTHYDHMPSPLTTVGGGTSTLFGDGGVLSGISNTLGDFQNGNFLSGIINATNTFQNSRDLSLGSVANEVLSAASLSNMQSATSGILFPRAVVNTDSTLANPVTFNGS